MIRIRCGRAYRPSPPVALWGLALGRLRHEESRTALACVDLWVVGVIPLGAARARRIVQYLLAIPWPGAFRWDSRPHGPSAGASSIAHSRIHYPGQTEVHKHI